MKSEVPGFEDGEVLVFSTERSCGAMGDRPWSGGEDFLAAWPLTPNPL